MAEETTDLTQTEAPEKTADMIETAEVAPVVKETTPTRIEKEPSNRAILFELENLAADGRQKFFDLLKKALKEKNVALSPTQFSRYCLDMPLKESLAQFLESADKTRVSEEKLSETVLKDFNASLSKSAGKGQAGLPKILEEAKSRGLAIGALCCLGTPVMESVAKSSSMADYGVSLLSQSADDKLYPSADAWLKLARQIDIIPPLCVALATSMKSCKSALSAGMRCIVVTDEYTGFQDFGGADYVVESLDDETHERLFGLVESV